MSSVAGAVADLVGADVLQRAGQLLGPRLGLLALAVLPVEIAGDGEQEQHDGADDDPAIALGALGHLVAAKIFVDLANEAVGSIVGEAPRIIPLVSSGQCRPLRPHSPPRMNKSWRRRSSARDTKGKEGAGRAATRRASRRGTSPSDPPFVGLSFAVAALPMPATAWSKRGLSAPRSGAIGAVVDNEKAKGRSLEMSEKFTSLSPPCGHLRGLRGDRSGQREGPADHGHRDRRATSRCGSCRIAISTSPRRPMREDPRPTGAARGAATSASNRSPDSAASIGLMPELPLGRVAGRAAADRPRASRGRGEIAANGFSAIAPVAITISVR